MMFFSSLQSVFRPLAIALLFSLAGCGGDGLNVSDNTPSGPYGGSGSVTGGSNPATSLTLVGLPVPIDATKSVTSYVHDDDGAVESFSVLEVGTNNVLAIWTQADGIPSDNTNNVDLRYNYYSSATHNWSGPGDIETSGDVKNPLVVVDNAGTVMAVWTQEDYLLGADVPRTNLYASCFNGATWTARTEIDAGNIAVAAQTKDVTDIRDIFLLVRNNVITAVWVQHDGTSYNLHMSHYTAGACGGAWSNPVAAIDTQVGNVSTPLAKVKGAELYAIWRQYNAGNSTNDLYGVRYNNTAMVGTVDLLDTNTNDV